MRNLFRQSCGIAMLLTAVACGSNDDAGTNESAEGTAGTSASTATAGTSAASAGSKSSPRAGSGAATGAAGSTGAAARGGSSASMQPSAAGKGAAGTSGSDMADEDAGVPATAGSGGSAAAGSGGTAPAAGSGGATGAAGAGGSSASAATFTQVYALISAGCAGAACHVNATTPGGMLSMPDKATAYKNLVDANSTQCSGEKRVVPGDPAKSELVASLKHTQVGSCARTPRMPDDMPKWNDSDIAVVVSWVQAGAQDN